MLPPANPSPPRELAVSPLFRGVTIRASIRRAVQLSKKQVGYIDFPPREYDRNRDIRTFDAESTASAALQSA